MEELNKLIEEYEEIKSKHKLLLRSHKARLIYIKFKIQELTEQAGGKVEHEIII